MHEEAGAIGVTGLSEFSLRDRRAEISHLTEFFIDKYARRYKRPVRQLSAELQQLFQSYEWPGNIRELENVIERAVALEASAAILPDGLPPQLRGLPSKNGQTVTQLPDTGFDLEAHVENVERDYIAQALKRAGGKQSKAAELLGMSFRSFRYYVKKYNLR